MRSRSHFGYSPEVPMMKRASLNISLTGGDRVFCGEGGVGDGERDWPEDQRKLKESTRQQLYMNSILDSIINPSML